MQEPRDPRVEKTSTRDFADFIRSTGPGHPQQLPASIASRPATANADSSPRPASITQTPSAKPVENLSKVARSQTVSPTTTFASSQKRASRLEARPAALPQGNKSADLIDFIREGPPHDPRDGNHRIPRTIAPFRTTMDSDEISALGVVRAGATVDRDALARISVASTQESSVPAMSVHSSMNSRTGLLDSTNQTATRMNNQPVTPWSPSQNEDAPPHRKQRRVRDPYAIDSDSEEEALFAASQKPKREEESLIDFLRNVAPPSESQTTPQLLSTAAAANVQKKNSAPNIKDRIMRKSSVTTATSKGRGREPMSQTARRSSNGAHQSLPSPQRSARSISPHLSQTGSRLDTYKPTQPTYAAHIDRVRSNKSATQGQARSGRNEASSSAELADFLMNSGPPATTQTYVPSVAKEETGFSRMFSRKKKAVA
jgi:hypothetical protein